MLLALLRLCQQPLEDGDPVVDASVVALERRDLGGERELCCLPRREMELDCLQSIAIRGAEAPVGEARRTTCADAADGALTSMSRCLRAASAAPRANTLGMPLYSTARLGALPRGGLGGGLAYLVVRRAVAALVGFSRRSDTPRDALRRTSSAGVIAMVSRSVNASPAGREADGRAKIAVTPLQPAHARFAAKRRTLGSNGTHPCHPSACQAQCPPQRRGKGCAAARQDAPKASRPRRHSVPRCHHRPTAAPPHPGRRSRSAARTTAWHVTTLQNARDFVSAARYFAPEVGADLFTGKATAEELNANDGDGRPCPRWEMNARVA